MKQACKNCGQIHLNCPFTDCFSSKDDGELPDSLEDYYKNKFDEDN